MRFALRLLLTLALCACMFQPCAASEPVQEAGISTREAKMLAIHGVPFQRLHPIAGNQVRDVLEHPSYFRRMPKQEISCDPQMFTFLVRRPEVMVNIWEIMGITKVRAQRTSPFTFVADDGVGTACKCDLIYADGDMHIYLGHGAYDGSMSPNKVTGRCVCILRTQNQTVEAGSPNIAGTMDVFLKLDNFGADLLTRTIGPFVGKTADYNFVETARFIAQVSQICQMNPAGAQALVSKLDNIDDATRREFAEIVTRIASTSAAADGPQQTHKSMKTAEIAGQLDFDASPHREPQQSSRLRSAVVGSTLTDRHVLSEAATRPLPQPPPTAIAPSKPNIYMRR